MYSTFYCTHSIGPIVHATGLRPVSVIGFEGGRNQQPSRNGAKGAQFGITMMTMENGAVVKSINGCFLYEHSIWYSMSGNKGIMESARELAQQGGTQHIYVKCDDYDGQHKEEAPQSYDPIPDNPTASATFGHGGSDFYSMYHFVERILGDQNADTIDVYEALDMFLPGMFAFRSILNNGQRMDIPDLRDKSIRDKWRNDTACVDPNVAGDQLLPTRAGGTPQIPDSVYDAVKAKWDEAQRTGNDFYRNAAFSQGAGTK